MYMRDRAALQRTLMLIDKVLEKDHGATNMVAG
jgi:hypothetical protein